METKKALKCVIFWIALALVFNLGIYLGIIYLGYFQAITIDLNKLI